MEDTHMPKTSTPDLEESSSNHKAEISSLDKLEVSMICTKGHGRYASHHSGTAKLVQTNLGKDTILEIKVHLTFVNSYPELTKKSQFSCEALLRAAHKQKAVLVEKQIKTDKSYAMALANLYAGQSLSSNLPCPNSDCTSVAQPFLRTHSYHCVLQFNNMPTALSKKPCVGDIMVHLMKGHYFNGSQSVGVPFAKWFNEIVENKSNIQVYAALSWKASSCLSKFNFTGNQFSEVYLLHVKILEDLRMRVPEKFHKLMANIFEAIQKLGHNTISTTSHAEALAFLDIDDGMDSK
ncbi:uncharacterized protein BJ212DRAFT_1555942 [Suillus subaureus]|uniref:DUF6532 domain-containing protein n=1 Tax=Suillus subaureus TaxID=48587 RepID=A0A9P7DRI4_9AGAM|nr:uncharacterized protein BJ212DRAFT_1555942 [Suillus subaureus]KAG1801291.1 hypothetical protein BJ212DRAFT_1555942 [Suillus subaureus]